MFLKEFHGETMEVLVHNPHPRNVPERGASSYIKAQNDCLPLFQKLFGEISISTLKPPKRWLPLKCNSKDIKHRNALKGMVIGLFTIEEYSSHINSSNLNKRMMNMLIERLKKSGSVV
jgi:hypothetical protein